RVLAEVIGMLAAGVVHGDLSDFNVLMGADGPVIIDLPQAVDASSNRNARKLLLRDVDNLHRFLAGFIPGRRPPPYAEEMWQLYERGELTADAKLTGNYRPTNDGLALTDEVLALIAEAERDERRQRERRGVQTRGGANQGTSASRQPAPGGRGPSPSPGGRSPSPARRGRGPARPPRKPNK